MPGGPDEPGLLLRGVARQAEVGFLSLFEHYRCCEARGEGRAAALTIFVTDATVWDLKDEAPEYITHHSGYRAPASRCVVRIKANTEVRYQALPLERAWCGGAGGAGRAPLRSPLIARCT